MIVHNCAGATWSETTAHAPGIATNHFQRRHERECLCLSRMGIAGFIGHGVRYAISHSAHRVCGWSARTHQDAIKGPLLVKTRGPKSHISRASLKCDARATRKVAEKI
jgi:hypothetical protein